MSLTIISKRGDLRSEIQEARRKKQNLDVRIILPLADRPGGIRQKEFNRHKKQELHASFYDSNIFIKTFGKVNQNQGTVILNWRLRR